jgi:hypothetical protein
MEEVSRVCIHLRKSLYCPLTYTLDNLYTFACFTLNLVLINYTRLSDRIFSVTLHTYVTFKYDEIDRNHLIDASI